MKLAATMAGRSAVTALARVGLRRTRTVDPWGARVVYGSHIRRDEDPCL